jgi:hypothetical protein
MARFQLVPLEQESAISQLFRCARMATILIMKCHGFYGLYREYRDEVFDDIVFETVRHFIEYKVKRHTYCRQTKEGKPLAFADNVLSSCFGVASRVVDVFLKHLTRINETADIEPMKFCLSYADKLPMYVSDSERIARYKYKAKLVRGSDRARVARMEYEDYVEEAKEMGLSEILELGPWLVRNGYGDDDEVFFYMESKPERRKLLQGQALWVSETKQAERDSLIKNKSVLHAQIYNREYKKRKRHEEWKRLSEEYQKLYGPPPEGYIWKERRGIVGLYKLKEEDK